MCAFPVCGDSRGRLIKVATGAFVEKGYRVSVDHIAARAGVIKQTLYNHFPTRECLFEAVVSVASESILLPLDAESENVRATLLGFARTYRSRALNDEGIAMFRVVSGEATRGPAFARDVFATSADKIVGGLAAFLDKDMVGGNLRRDNARFAAEMLMSMAVGINRVRRLMGCNPLPAKAEAARVCKIVDCFLHAFAP